MSKTTEPLMRSLRGTWTRIISADPPCAECGRPTFYPGALRADVCKAHYAERLRASA